MTELTSAVREAQADADRRFGDGPVQPWEPPPVLSASTRRRLAAVAMASLLGTALLVAIAVAKTAPAVVDPPAEPVPPVSDALADRERAEEDVPPVVIPPTAAAPRFDLERRGAEWRFSARGAARHDVLQRLAEASGSTIHASPLAVDETRPVQLQWQGRSLAQLWPLVLGPELNFALQCRRDQCEVWILGTARPGTSPTTPSPPSPTWDVPALPVPGTDQDSPPIRD